ncbi:acetate uptake transporter [Escherichia coli]
MGNTKLANPAPLGLMGFGMTTILLNLHNVGYFALDGIILAMGISTAASRKFLPVCGVQKGNTFGLTAFTSYGSFSAAIVDDSADAETGADRCAKCPVPWCQPGSVGHIVAVYVLRHAERHTRSAIVFFSLTVLFALLAIGNIAGNAAIIHFAGWIGLTAVPAQSIWRWVKC